MSCPLSNLRRFRRLSQALARLRSRVGREGGFTLIELMVASGIIATALTLLAGVIGSGLQATGYARERQFATQLANQTLEQIRSLPFNQMKAGLGDTDLSSNTDSNIAGSGCGSTYCFGGEQIAHGVNATIDPLVPHQKTMVGSPGATTYTIGSYVTYYQNVTTADARRVTVYVTWNSPLKGNASRSIQAQTIMFANAATGTGNVCGSFAAHPFLGPCLASFTAHADQDPSSIKISGSLGGIGLDHATLYGGRATSDSTIEQIANEEGVTQSSGAAVQQVAGAETALGSLSVASKADNDPTLLHGIYDSQALSSPASFNAATSFGATSLTLQGAGGDSGTTTSTTSACTSGNCTNPTTPSPRTCPNLTGYTAEIDGYQCGGSGIQSASTTAQANVPTAGTVTLAALAAQSTPTVAITNRNAVGSGNCSGDGCLRAQVTRSALDMSAGALPQNLSAVLKPVGFTYFAQITGLNDSVMAEAGVNSAAPTAPAATGNVKIYCPVAIGGDPLCSVLGYVTKAFSAITTTMTTPLWTITDGSLGGGTTITIQGTITPPSVSTSSTCGGTCTRTSSDAQSVPPTVSMTYKIVMAGTTVLDTTMVLNPGTLTARASYASAPTS